MSHVPCRDLLLNTVASERDLEEKTEQSPLLIMVS